jgi:hypothetical protein
MFKLTKRIATVAAVFLAAIAPSAAYARLNLDPPTTAPAVSSQTINAQTLNAQTLTAATPSSGKASVSSSQDFQWDDAVIGAAGMLILLSVGSGAIITLRRRAHHPLTS